LHQILTPEGILAAGQQPQLSSEELKRMLRLMLKVRTVDQRMLNLQRQGRIAFHGMTTGEEAAVIGSALALKPTDWVFAALRQSGVMLTRGWPLRKFVAQSMGNSEDALKGKMQPCHYADRGVNQVSWSSVIGTQLPHAVGAAYGMRLQKKNEVAIAYCGDGATSSSDFHVAANFAGVWKVPLVLFIQNNQWAISVPRERQTATAKLSDKGQAYGLESVQVDGNDVLAVYEVTQRAVDRARLGDGPTLIEAVTYRRSGHSSSDDPDKYRPGGEAEGWEKKDPIDRFTTYLRSIGAWTDADQSATELEFGAELDDAIRHNETVAPPNLRSLVEDVYAEVPWHLREQFDQMIAVCGEDFTGTAEGKFPL